MNYRTDKAYKETWEGFVLSIMTTHKPENGFQFITLDAPDTPEITRQEVFGKAKKLCWWLNSIAFGKRWRDKKEGLLIIYVVERTGGMWHVHLLHEKHMLLNPMMYEYLWLHSWRGRLVDCPRKPVDVRPAQELGIKLARYMTKQTTEDNYPFVAGPTLLIEKNPVKSRR